MPLKRASVPHALLAGKMPGEEMHRFDCWPAVEHALEAGAQLFRLQVENDWACRHSK